MKNTSRILGLMLVFMIFACKKTRTCTCKIAQTANTVVSYNNGVPTTSSVTTMNNTDVKNNSHMTKKTAYTAFDCYNRNEAYTDVNTAYSGTLVTTTTINHSDDYSCTLK